MEVAINTTSYKYIHMIHIIIGGVVTGSLKINVAGLQAGVGQTVPPGHSPQKSEAFEATEEDEEKRAKVYYWN